MRYEYRLNRYYTVCLPTMAGSQTTEMIRLCRSQLHTVSNSFPSDRGTTPDQLCSESVVDSARKSPQPLASFRASFRDFLLSTFRHGQSTRISRDGRTSLERHWNVINCFSRRARIRGCSLFGCWVELPCYFPRLARR